MRGKGMAFSLRHGSFGGGQTDAMAVVDASGTMTMRHNAPDLGQGIFNLISVITARSLDIPQSKFRSPCRTLRCGSRSWESIHSGPRFN